MKKFLTNHPVSKNTAPQVDIIAARFSKKASHYDQFAKVQKFAANSLYKKISNNINLVIPTNILEIGCGTGILSRYLANGFPESEIEFLDPAAEMLRICETNLHEQLEFNKTPKHYKFIKKSIEDYINEEKFSANKYSLIASSFTLHWIENLPAVINKLIESLEIGGQLFFSYPTNKSFPEWKSVCQQLSLPFSGNPLPSAEQLALSLKTNRANIIWNEYCFKLEFTNALEFFQEIKHLGATTTTACKQSDRNMLAQQLTVSEFRRLVKTWNQISNNNKKHNEIRDTYNQTVDCTYWLVEGIITRHS